MVATLVSVRNNHAMNPSLHLLNPENMVGRLVDAPIDEICAEHIKVLYYLSRSRKFRPVRTTMHAHGHGNPSK